MAAVAGRAGQTVAIQAVRCCPCAGGLMWHRDENMSRGMVGAQWWRWAGGQHDRRQGTLPALRLLSPSALQNQVATVQQSTSNKCRSHYKPKYNSVCLFLGFCYFPFTSCPWWKSSLQQHFLPHNTLCPAVLYRTSVLPFICNIHWGWWKLCIHRSCHRLSYRKPSSLVTYAHRFLLPSLTHIFFPLFDELHS